MVAHLLELGQRVENASPSINACGGFESSLRLSQNRLVERDLFPCEIAVLLGLMLVGQVVYDVPGRS